MGFGVFIRYNCFMLPSKILSLIEQYAEVGQDGITLSLKQQPSYEQLKQLIWEYVFSQNSNDKKGAKYAIWEFAHQKGIFPASIIDVYRARGEGRLANNFTVPAFNIRGHTFELSKLIFQEAQKQGVKHFIFELARTEMKYTDQSPEEFSTCILAGALAGGWVGPVYIQGDHFQPQAKSPGIAKDGEYESIKKLIDDSINNGFFNIDIDCSTLVDLSLPNVPDQQKENIRGTLELAKYIRSKQLEGLEISIGGEIGHIGGKNSSHEDLAVFLEGFYRGWNLQSYGLSKVAIQNGTSHGGNIGADGKVVESECDLGLMLDASRYCREAYKIGGVVQHGASTQSAEFLKKLPEHEIIEVHLATGIQNAIFDDPSFPAELKQQMGHWLMSELAQECDPTWTLAQCQYKLRKKAWGKFKREIWECNVDLKPLENLFSRYFDALFLRAT